MRVVQAAPTETFSFGLFHLQSDGKIIGAIPIINGWTQLELEVITVPNDAAQIAFFQHISTLVDNLTAADDLVAWYFLHKPPGLKLRFQFARDHVAGLTRIVETIADWRWPWLGRTSFGSFFDQAELLGGFHRQDVDALLTTSANVYVQSLLHHRRVGGVDWSIFVVDFFKAILSDDWIVWEALGRFQRLRERGIIRHGRAGDDFADPRAMLPLVKDFRPVQPGFEASVSLLQSLNYIFNMWAIDEASQSAILEEARGLVRPELVKS